MDHPDAWPGLLAHAPASTAAAAAGTHARTVFGFAKAMVAEAQQVLMPHNQQPVMLRVCAGRG